MRSLLDSQIAVTATIACVAITAFSLATHQPRATESLLAQPLKTVDKDLLISSRYLPRTLLNPGQTIRVVSTGGGDWIDGSLVFKLPDRLPDGQLDDQRFLQGYAAAVSFRAEAPFL